MSDNSKRHMVKLYNDQVGYNKRLVRKLVEKKYLSSFNEDGEYLIARVRKLVKENSWDGWNKANSKKLIVLN